MTSIRRAIAAIAITALAAIAAAGIYAESHRVPDQP
jgi:hypothetical protein